MSASNVTVVSRMRGECLAAECALERLLAAVLTDMRPQDGAGGEGLAAVRALIRTLTGVDSKMLNTADLNWW